LPQSDQLSGAAVAKQKRTSKSEVRSAKKARGTKETTTRKVKSRVSDTDALVGEGLLVAPKKKTTAVRKKSTRLVPKASEEIQAEKQALAMWGLLSEGGQAYGGKLKPRIDEAERVALEQAGLVEIMMVKRAFLLTVTDKGWDWAEQHLNASLPNNISGAAILQSWLTRLHAFLRARGLRLSELFTDQPAGSEPMLAAQTSPDYPELREQIRNAYYEVAGEFNRRVLLRDLRRKLVGLDRSLIDQTLMQMLRNEEVSLMQLDYRPGVSDEDHAAALQIGSEPRHIIWISK
jgi:hypothetical protein